MAYDRQLAERIQQIIGNDPDVTEKAMFGGLAFLLSGNMAVSASGHGGILLRVDPATGDELVKTTDAELMVMRGRSMAGWLRIDEDHLTDDELLKKWVLMGIDYARTLPPKN